MSKNLTVNIFKVLSGWCVSIPVYFYENEDEVATKIREFQNKVNEGISDDPVLDKLLSKTKIKRVKKSGEYRVASIKDNSLLYFTSKHQALFFVNILFEEDGNQNNKLDIEAAYNLAVKQITE